MRKAQFMVKNLETYQILFGNEQDQVMGVNVEEICVGPVRTDLFCVGPVGLYSELALRTNPR
jgi:hypothetical protein